MTGLVLVAAFTGIVFWIVRQWEEPPTKPTEDEEREFWRAW